MTYLYGDKRGKTYVARAGGTGPLVRGQTRTLSNTNELVSGRLEFLDCIRKDVMSTKAIGQIWA